MPSTKFQKIAKKIVRENQAIFDTLLEFEKTKKIRTKTRLNFTIDRTIASQFRKLCREKGYNMSLRIEQAMKKEMER